MVTYTKPQQRKKEGPKKEVMTYNVGKNFIDKSSASN